MTTRKRKIDAQARKNKKRKIAAKAAGEAHKKNKPSCKNKLLEKLIKKEE